MYIIMESLRQEIRDEMKSLRINKTHVYDILMRLVDELDSTSVVAPTPVAPTPVAAPVEESTSTPDVVPVEESTPTPIEETPKTVKKIVRRTRKTAELA
jgi:hypothetical protein